MDRVKCHESKDMFLFAAKAKSIILANLKSVMSKVQPKNQCRSHKYLFFVCLFSVSEFGLMDSYTHNKHS